MRVLFDSTSCNEDIDIGVSFDGTWNKQENSSLYCIRCFIDILRGLVIDFEIISKHCNDCYKTAADLGNDNPEYAVWYADHSKSGKCEKNYDGSQVRWKFMLLVRIKAIVDITDSLIGAFL